MKLPICWRKEDEKNSLKGLAILLVFTFVISLGFPQITEAKEKYRTEQMLVYKRVSIRVPDEDFQSAKKFNQSKIFKLGKKYQMDYRLKGLSYEITFTFTKKHK